MNNYVDIQILPTHEFSVNDLMNALFNQLHLAFVEIGAGEVGVSFPRVDKTLGSLLRLHGQEASLQKILSSPKLLKCKDYISISSVAPIPKNVSYRVVRRVQAKSSPERLLRRSLRKGWITEDGALEKLKKMKDETLLLPHLRIKSLSTRQDFLIFVEHGPLVETASSGVFSAYGLSSTATIPWF